MQRALLLVLTMSGTLAAATSAAAETAERRGQILVTRHCASCHAVGVSGASKEPAALPFREIGRRYDPEQLQEALAEGLLTGHPMMPEFRFPPEDGKAIIRYLKSIQTRQPG
ncbi:c-type cytochrome [Phenylobacterium sp.]|jgi:mono/diheme cytochrome c family protein|uniref:c-type cytochrome n=1 Tax=Phenylobacterium sp. TaxID=1871053 RepID=UPI0037CB2693